VAWGGFCTAAPGHGSLFFFLCWQGMVGMGSVGFLEQVGWRERE
jgi:hypothetical protein